MEDSSASEGAAKSDMDKRVQARRDKKSKLKNPVRSRRSIRLFVCFICCYRHNPSIVVVGLTHVPRILSLFFFFNTIFSHFLVFSRLKIYFS